MPAFVRLLVGLILGLLSALTPPSAGAGSFLDGVSARGTLRIGLTGDYRPFSLIDPQTGEWSGMDVELGRQLAASMGAQPEFVRTAWPQLSGDMQAGRFDIAMGGISVTPERAKIGIFTSAILSDGKTPIARCEDQFRFQTLPAINQASVRVIVNPGGTNERFARAHFSQAQLIVHPDNRSIFDEIIHGRADVMVTDATEARLQSRLHAELCAIHPDTPFDHSDKAYLMQKDAALAEQVEAWLANMRASGALQSMIDKWINGRLALMPLQSSTVSVQAGE
jgi:cyclohexadienyl dehydratase